MMLLLLLVLVGAGLGAVAEGAEAEVKPLAACPFVLPGLPESPDARPKVLLWCQGARLLGVLVPTQAREKLAGAGPNRPAPTALLLRDGRCDPDGALSFGFLVPLKAWVYESATRTPPEGRTTWLLHRFEGSLQAGLLKGVLVQADVNHPGNPFRESKVETTALSETQTPFADEAEWLASMTRSHTLAPSEP